MKPLRYCLKVCAITSAQSVFRLLVFPQNCQEEERPCKRVYSREKYFTLPTGGSFAEHPLSSLSEDCSAIHGSFGLHFIFFTKVEAVTVYRSDYYLYYYYCPIITISLEMKDFIVVYASSAHLDDGLGRRTSVRN